MFQEGRECIASLQYFALNRAKMLILISLEKRKVNFVGADGNSIIFFDHIVMAFEQVLKVIFEDFGLKE